MRRAANAAAVAAAVIVAMAVGRLITDHVPVAEVSDQPFERTGQVGEDMELEYADLTVQGVRSARTLINDPDRIPATENSVFLIADVKIRATRRSTLLFASVVDASGRYHYPTNRAGCAKSLSAPTRVTRYGMFCFEVTRDALRGATLKLSRSEVSFEGSEQRRDELALVDLALTADRVGQLWDTKKTYAAEQPSLYPLDKRPVPEESP